MPWSVLVVDDDSSTRQVLSCLVELDDQLRLEGTASNGREAVELVGRRCPDAIVCDLEMPLMTGEEAVPRLRTTCTMTPVCVVLGIIRWAKVTRVSRSSATVRRAVR
jgi:two-component system, chemotaxis family, protein-glutamate methylesterase/glutaminase